MKITGYIVFVLSVCASSTLVAQSPIEKKASRLFQLKDLPSKENVWVFLLAGQSNMAGRGLIEPQDTLTDKRLLSINSTEDLILAREPIHFYEPAGAGLDCGLSFGKTMLRYCPARISILLIPAAVGGTHIQQWIGDSTHRGVKLLSNFKKKVAIGRRYGTIKAILWHQGEGDANPTRIPLYQSKLAELFTMFRQIVENDSLPILAGEIGSFSEKNENWQLINKALRNYSVQDSHSALIATQDLNHKGDKVHFDSKGQRLMGERFAKEYLRITR